MFDPKKAVDLPLLDPLKVNLFQDTGRKKPKRVKPQYSDEIGDKLTGKELSDLKEKKKWEKISELLDYYFRTGLDPEIVAKYIGCDVDIVVRGFEARRNAKGDR